MVVRDEIKERLNKHGELEIVILSIMRALFSSLCLTQLLYARHSC